MSSISKFINLWWAKTPSSVPGSTLDWMDRSYLEPPFFWAELFAYQESVTSLPLHSSFEDQYDFYHDCVVRHIESKRAVLKVFKKDSEVESWTYEELHRCVNYQIKKWKDYSLLPGQLVAIVAPPGFYFLIALFTTLRLGLQFCYFPTESPSLAKKEIVRIIETIKPNLLVTTLEDDTFISYKSPIILLNEIRQDEQNYHPTSYFYPAKELLQKSLSTYTQNTDSLLSLDVNTTYLHALRDGLIALNLKPGMSYVSPLSCPIQTKPCTIFMTLILGATLVEVSDDTIRDSPTLLKDKKIDIIGISEPLEQLWSKEGGLPTTQLKCCYKNPLTSNSQRWKSFIEQNKMEKIPTYNLIIDNSRGGITLFSKPCIDNLDFFIRPSLGTPWSLTQINGRDDPSLNGFGVFHLHLSCRKPNTKENNLILAQIGTEWIISGTIVPCRDGNTFPIKKVEEVVSAIPFVKGCMIYTLPQTGRVASHQFLLLLFINPMKIDQEQDSLTKEIVFQIENNIGSAFLPSRIEYYPLYPKMEDGAIDRNWCSSQYAEGLLSRKKNMQVYQILGTLKMLVGEKVNG